MAKSAFAQDIVSHGLADERDLALLRQRSGGADFDIAARLFELLELPDDRELLGKLYGNSIGKAHVPLDKTLFQPKALDKLVPDMARRLGCIPVYYLGDVLTVAMPHPEDAQAVADIERLVGDPVSAVFAFPDEIESSLDVQYGPSGDGLEKLSDRLSSEIDPLNEITEAKLKELAASAGVVDLVRGLMLYCVKNNASDIHIQPAAKTLDVRFRIDGELRTLVRLSKSMNAPIASRLKVMASLDITEKRQPQDGRVSLDLKTRSYDFRLSTVPTVFGEKAVIRAIGATDKRVKPLHELGFSRHNMRQLNDLLKLPNGVIYVTGPTGSGKTTTLYSILSKLHRPELNIVSVEDPVELRIDGTTQIQTNAAIGLDFAKALRAVLRQDPEIVLIGEIRDLETAEIASQAALTGHLVMSTLHTNSALQAIPRLVDLGVKANLVAPSVIGVMAQRLVRRICDRCKEAYDPDEDILDSLFHNRGDKRVQFYRGRGCDACSHSGYVGRLAIHEIIVVTDVIREMISNEASIVEIQRELNRTGFRSLRYDGVLKVLLGLTTFDEIDRVTVA